MINVLGVLMVSPVKILVNVLLIYLTLMMLLQAREKYLSLRKSTKNDVASLLEEVITLIIL